MSRNTPRLSWNFWNGTPKKSNAVGRTNKQSQKQFQCQLTKWLFLKLCPTNLETYKVFTESNLGIICRKSYSLKSTFLLPVFKVVICLRVS